MIQNLIAASTNGDSAAREKLFAQIHEFLHLMADKHLDSKLRHKIAPSDIVQQTFLNVDKNLNEYRGEGEAQFYAWLKAIVVNEVKNARRDLSAAKRDVTREKPQASSDSGQLNCSQDKNPTPSTEALANEQVDNFYEILKKLEPDHAEIIQLRSIEQLPFKDVALRMGRTQNAVTKLWYRAVIKFEDLLRQSEAFKSRAGENAAHDQ
ncbi:MAG: sigma-70 family RNA polymerase sigma factor [Planctomycetota bacterium]